LFNSIEYLIFRFFYKKEEKTFINFPDGITAVSLFICINIANKLSEVVMLSFGFTFGIFIVNVIIGEIRRRAELEAVPVFLRGKPLIIIAMGLLSLVFTAASLLFFRMINAG
jgi:electron transport complex protein RnfA